MSHTLDVLDREDAILVAQPVCQGYIPQARAVATSILYKYLGLNVGYGACDGTHKAPVDSSEALRRLGSPLHTLQIVFAEWLLVYASGACDIRLSNGEGAEGATIVTRPADVHLCKSGNHIPTPAALLGFVADWIGSILPRYTNIPGAHIARATSGIQAVLLGLRPSKTPCDSAVGKFYVQGLRADSDDFLARINVAFSDEDDDNATKVLVASFGEDDLILRPLRKVIGKTGNVAASHDSAVSQAEVLSPESVSLEVSDDDFVAVASGENVCVAKQDNAEIWHSLLPADAEKPTLVSVVIRAIVDTMFDAYDSTPGFMELRDIETHSLTLMSGKYSSIVEAIMKKHQVHQHEGVAETEDDASEVSSSEQESYIQDLPFSMATTRPLHPKAGPVMTLYFSPAEFTESVVTLEIVRDFFATYALLEDERYVYLTENGALLGSAKKGKTLKFAEGSEYDVDLNDCESLTDSGMTWSVMFTREDLLAIGLSTNAKIRESFGVLRKAHKHQQHSRFDEEVSDLIAQQVVDGSSVLDYANEWNDGPILEFSFRLGQFKSLSALITSMYCMLDMFVVRNSDGMFIGSVEPDENDKMIVHTEIVCDHSGSSLSLSRLVKPKTIDASDADGLTEPWLHAFTLSTIQANFLACASSEYVFESIKEGLLNVADPNVVNNVELASEMQNDLNDLQRMFQLV